MNHAPGVACIVHGLTATWSSRDNGRIVVIIKLARESRIYGKFWVVRPREGEPDLHSYNNDRQPNRSRRVSTLQKNLIPLGPEPYLEHHAEPQDTQAEAAAAAAINDN